MSFEALTDRLKALQESNIQLKALIERLATINFQPGSLPLNDGDEGNIITELKLEIHQTLKDQEEDFEVLKEEVVDLDSGRVGGELEQQRNALIQAVDRALKELRTYQSAFRRAQLAARQSLQKAQQLERQLLVQSYSDPKLQSDTSSVTPPTRRRAQHNTELSKDEKAINASSEVTLALRRTHDVMASELSRSQFAHDTLKESTAALSQLSETYSTLDTLLSSSKNLLGTLLRSQKSDTWYLETAFYVLLTTIAWLIFRRWLYGPLWWFVWFPLRMFFKGSAGVLTTVGVIGGASNAAGDGTSSAISHTVVHNSGTRGPKPTGGPPGKANSINVGGGGRGAPMRPRDPPQPQGEGSLSEKVGKIIDGSRSDQPGEEETLTGFTEEQKEGVEEINPKKRMWEENEVTEETSKDEL